MTDRRAAFELRRPPSPVLMLAQSEVERLLEPAALIDALADGFGALARGEVQAPPRAQILVPDAGFSLAKPAWRTGEQITVKVVNGFSGNAARGLPTLLALVCLFDPQTGAPTCVMDGTCVTGLRTAAAAALSVRLLARRDARRALVVGAGVQAREHLRMLPQVGAFDSIAVWARRREDAQALVRAEAVVDSGAGRPRLLAVDDLESAVRAAEVVCLCTHAATPVLQAAWVAPGTHVTSVGFNPPGGELPRQLLAPGDVFVETVDAVAPPPVGCAELQGLTPAEVSALGDIVLGRVPARRDATQITTYKSMGLAMEDLVAANLAYRRALAEGAGTRVPL